MLNDDAGWWGGWLMAATGWCGFVLAGAGCLTLRRKLERERRRHLRQRGRRASARADARAAAAAVAEADRRFDAAYDQLQEAFAALSAETLQNTQGRFLELARTTLARERDAAGADLAERQRAVADLVGPLRERLAATNEAVAATERARREAYGGLKQQLRAVTEGQRELRDATGGLVTALRRPEVRGRWGELQLRRVVELAGMSEHCDFVTQAGVGGGDAGGPGALRPDLVVRLPAGREIVIDAKTPMDAYLDAAEASASARRNERLDAHVRQIEAKVRELAGKRYQDHCAAADFTVLFLPGESFLYAATERRPEIIEKALARGVVIATPTTLIALLKTVALGWREERLSENATEIRTLGEELHRRLVTLTDHLDRTGRSLGRAVRDYNRLVGGFESRVLPQARRFDDLGAGSTPRLPAADQRPEPVTGPRRPAA